MLPGIIGQKEKQVRGTSRKNALNVECGYLSVKCKYCFKQMEHIERIKYSKWCSFICRECKTSLRVKSKFCYIHGDK